MTLTSTYTADEHTQQDGSRWVIERHTESDGRVHQYQYLLPDSMSADVIMQARAALLNAQIAEREAAAAFVAGTKLPITKLQFRELFTTAERMAIDALNAGFESHPALTVEQKATIRTGLEDYRMAENIAKPFDSRVQQMLGLYVALGLLTQARADEIVAAGGG